MAFLGQVFKPEDAPVSENSFDPIPAGEYQCTVKGAELKQTKAGTGAYISLQLGIDGPTHTGRVVFTNLNIQNPNEVAERIGREQLGQIQRAAGLGPVEDSDQLIGAQMAIKVTVKNDPTYGPGNEVKGFKPIGSAPPAVAQASTPVAAATQPAAQAAPWARK